MDNLVAPVKKTHRVKKTSKVISAPNGSSTKVTKVTKTPIRHKVKKQKFAKFATVGSEELKTLAPLKDSMKKMLQEKGFDTSKMSDEVLTVTYYNEFVSKKGDKVSNIEPLNVSDFENDILFSTPAGQHVDNLGASDVVGAVTGIVGFFKKANSKRKAIKREAAAAKLAPAETAALIAQTMTKTEQTAAKEADKVTTKLEEKAKTEAPVKQGNMKKYLLYGGGALLLIVILFMAFKK
jgi:hypothetical protein